MTKKLSIIIALVIISFGALAQTPGQQLAQKIADKMKDSLLLTVTQKGQLYAINVSIANQKSIVRQQYASTDSVGIKLQRVENTRDSLYRPVLTDEQYLLYRQKKRNLVNNN